MPDDLMLGMHPSTSLGIHGLCSRKIFDKA